jgi:hypothetical protein
MSLDVLRGLLLWCAIINYGVFYRFHGQWVPMPVEQFNALHYGGMAIYKIGVLLFNVVPYVALLIPARRDSRKS